MLGIHTAGRADGLFTAIFRDHTLSEILDFAHSIGCHAGDKYGSKVHATKAIVKWIEGQRALHALTGRTRLANWPYSLTKTNHDWTLCTYVWHGTEEVQHKPRAGYNTEREAWEAFRQQVVKAEEEHVPEGLEPRIQVNANIPVFASCQMDWTDKGVTKRIMVLLTKEVSA